MHRPADYEEYKSQSLRDSELFGPRLVQEIPWGDNEIIVDYGCGAGSTGAHFFLPSVKKANSKMVSVDSSSEMIAYANLTHPDPSIQYLVGDIMKNPAVLGIEAVDKIFSVYTLQFIPCQRDLYRRLWAALKPSGHLAFTMLTKITSFNVLIHLGRHEKWGHYMKGYVKFLPSWITEGGDGNIHHETERNLIKTYSWTSFDLRSFSCTVHYSCDCLD